MLLILLFVLCLGPCIILGRPQAPQAVPYSQPVQNPQAQQGSGSTPIPIISFTESVGGDGTFNFSYETGNGIKVQQGGYVKKGPAPQSRSGQLNADGSDDASGDIQVLAGSYSYTAPDGQVISLTYTADENGFQPQGEHLPTPPPIPPGIVSLLNQIPQDQSQNRNGPPVASQFPGNIQARSAEIIQDIEDIEAQR